MSSKIATLRILIVSVCLIHSANSLKAQSADGLNWGAMISGTTANINQISAVNSNFVVASGAGGTLLLYSNGAWNSFTGWDAYKASNTPFGAWANTTNMFVTALSESETWIGSYASQGNILKWNGSSFQTIPMGATQRVLRMNGFTRTDGSTVMFGMATNSKVFTYRTFNSGSPTASDIDVNGSGANFNILGVAGYDSTNMWAVGNTYLYRSENNGSSYTQYAAPSYSSGNVSTIAVFDSISALAGTDTGDLFMWSEADGFSSSKLYDFDFSITSIYAIDANKIWVAGYGGNLWYYGGSLASKIDLGTTNILTSISGNGTEIFVSGFNGEIYSTVPEPSTMVLGGMGMFLLILARSFWRSPKTCVG